MSDMIPDDVGSVSALNIPELIKTLEACGLVVLTDEDFVVEIPEKKEN